MYCVYLTIYLGSRLPPFYIGSTRKSRIDEGYRGSIASSEYKDIWKSEIKNNPHLFATKIISQTNTREEAYRREMSLQRKLNVVSNPLYINKSFVSHNGGFGGGFTGKKHNDQTKQKMSAIQKGRKNTWTPKHRPLHSQRMMGNNYALGKKHPEHSLRMKGNQHAKGLLWWNNGVSLKRSRSSPGPEWTQGYIKLSSKD